MAGQTLSGAEGHQTGEDTKQVIVRFEAERQALALLEHPNMAHVFNIEERLKLFLRVCEAVQHAHQKGIR